MVPLAPLETPIFKLFDSDHHRNITVYRMDNMPTMTLLAHRSSQQSTVLDTTCLLYGVQPETAPHSWACPAHSHELGPARRRLAECLEEKVGIRAASVRHQLWEPATMQQRAAALRTPSMQHIWSASSCVTSSRSPSVWYAHANAGATLPKVLGGPNSTMAWVLQELRVHQQAKRAGVPR